jgi:phospholipid N-methyltransferase
LAQSENTISAKDNLYSGTYSELASEERISKTKELFAKYIPDASGKSVFELGAGHGGNVEMLKSFGFTQENIYLNELLPERIAHIKSHYPSLKLYEGNIFNIHIDKKFDCIYQSTVFTSILDEKDRKELAKIIWQLLKPNGIVLWYDFIYNSPNNKTVKKVTVPEIKQLFPEAKNFEVRKVTLAPPIGRKVGKLYKMFNVPFLRTHVLAVIQK